MAERVPWQDLTRLAPHEILAEIVLPLPWLLLAWSLAAQGWSALALLAMAPFFTTALRLTHDTFHRNLGLERRAGDLLLFALSLLLGGALHAIEYTHLRHHRDSLGADDIEGRMARYGFWAALVRSPLYPLLIHVETLRRGSTRQRRWVRRELVAVALVQALIWSSGDTALQTLSLALLLANALVPMIGIWSVHRDCDSGHARSSRRGWLLRLSFNMLYHDEHHAYPGVPARRLPQLVQRIDAQRTDAVPDVLDFRLRRRPGTRAAGLLVLALLLAGCEPRSAAQAQIDVCALVLGAIDTTELPIAIAAPAHDTLAGSCLLRSDADAQRHAQVQVHLYTGAAARLHEGSLERTWRIALAEARSNYGSDGGTLALRRTRAGSVFGFERGGGGQILLQGRGLILEIGARGMERDDAFVMAERIWRALQR
ncbi:fatty acid desaturase [Tahibacter sp.]|uniref:fatty acid desaturase n=1 Tax=Tahibacter sp. TaxID=2056211 RepID=UPI0028C50DD7|nr:fatty acid desaturase [Tahibacter sp.]